MTPMTSLRKTLLLGAFAGVTGFAIGCVITTNGEDKACGDMGTFSHVEGDDCVCDFAGYEFCSNAADDFSCCETSADPCPEPNNHAGSDGQCYCNGGYEWCNPTDESDLSCCLSGDTDGGTGGKGTDSSGGTDTDSGGTSGDTDGSVDCSDAVDPDPLACSAAASGEFYCTNGNPSTPECGETYQCDGMEWVLVDTEEACMFDGYDFAYGCVDSPRTRTVDLVCGVGPGSPCDAGSNPGSCVDSENIDYCLFGKLTQDSCVRICQEIGDDRGVTYDTGLCVEEAGVADCFCCDVGDPGCGG